MPAQRYKTSLSRSFIAFSVFHLKISAIRIINFIAFFLLFAYTLGLGIPFLVVGLFAQQAQGWITRVGPRLRYVQYVFGVILVVIGTLMFTSQLALVANFEFLVRIVSSFDGIANGATITSLNPFSLAIAFIAGLASFLSPCVLPIVPGFLSYLASTALRNK